MLAIAQSSDSKLEAGRPRVTEACHEKPAAEITESGDEDHFGGASSNVSEEEVLRLLD